jgi:hypothetical protein
MSHLTNALPHGVPDPTGQHFLILNDEFIVLFPLEVSLPAVDQATLGSGERGFGGKDGLSREKGIGESMKIFEGCSGSHVRG